MDEEELQVVAKRGLSLLRIDTRTWETLKETRRRGSRFSMTFPHEAAKNVRRGSLVLIAIDDDHPELRVGLISSRQAVSTLDTRIIVDVVSRISPNTLQELLAPLAATSLGYVATRLGAENVALQSVSTKLGERVIELIADNPRNTATLQPIIARLRLPTQYKNARALQQDAINTALKAFEAVDAVEVVLSGNTALGAVHLMEDTVIQHDARSIPGWHLVSSYVTGHAVFRRGDGQLDVYTANKQPLEELFGVDLVYLNEKRECLVMVQYKMMEKSSRTRDDTGLISDGEEWVVRIDSQFRDEIRRMLVFDKDLAPVGPYRLNSGAFFFKLVKRNALTTTSAIVLSLGHLEQLLSNEKVRGPRGGLRISYSGLDGHYLHSDPFIELIRSGYVGTRGATTEHLRQLIESAMDGGRAVVAAIQSAIRSD